MYIYIARALSNLGISYANLGSNRVRKCYVDKDIDIDTSRYGYRYR